MDWNTATMGNTIGITDNEKNTRLKFQNSTEGGWFNLYYLKKQDWQKHQFIFLFVIQKNSSAHGHQYFMIIMRWNTRLIGWTKLLNSFNSLNRKKEVFVLDGKQCSSCNDHDNWIIHIIEIILSICCTGRYQNSLFPPNYRTWTWFEEWFNSHRLLQQSMKRYKNT